MSLTSEAGEEYEDYKRDCYALQVGRVADAWGVVGQRQVKLHVPVHQLMGAPGLVPLPVMATNAATAWAGARSSKQ